LKSSTLVKCHVGRQKRFFGGGVGGHFTKLCSAKFSTFTVKAFPRLACHKIQWLQFANRNVIDFQSWHSSRHFQIPITLAISTQHYCNCGLASTTICKRGSSKHHWVKNDYKNQLKLETLDALMWVSLWGLPMENMDWTRIYDTWKSRKTGGLCLWSWIVIKCIV
jgi:hypothetical protein